VRIEQLQAFLAIASTGSFQAAARQCDCTQSTISRQIQSLEADLGISLLHRHHHARLTVGGERFLPYARKICDEWAKSQQAIDELRSGKQPELCLAAIHSVCAHLLPPILHEFCDRYPDTELRVTSLGSDRALKVLKDGLVDLAIVMDNKLFTTSPELVVEPLFSESIEVLMAAEHPLAEWERVPWDRLADYPQVVFKDGYGMQRLVQSQFQRIGRPLKVMLELNSLDAFRGVVRHGSAIALLPKSALTDLATDAHLTTRSIDVLNNDRLDFTRQVIMVTTSDRLAIPPIQYFFDRTKHHLKQ
jgi:DNA-binding transcriptional LysR family regulator